MSDSCEDSCGTRINLENVKQNRELIYSNKTLKLFTLTKKLDCPRSELSYQKELEQEEYKSSDCTISTDQKRKLEITSQNMEENNNRNPSGGRTVDDLLKMLSSRGSSSVSTTDRPAPPPLPPKPKPKSTPTTDRGFMRFFSSNKQTQQSASNYTNIDKADAVNYSYDQPHTMSAGDNNNCDYMYHNTQSYLTNTKPITTTTTTTGTRKFIELSEHFPHEISSTKTTIKQQATIMDDNNDDDYSSSAMAEQEPIVTESPEEANINSKPPNRGANRASNISTVEILEVPFASEQQKLNSTYGLGSCNNGSNNPTFYRSNKQNTQLFHENNNSHNNPVVTSATDEDDEENDSSGDNCVNRQIDANYAKVAPANSRVDILLDDSTRENLQQNQPLRTSTPTNSTFLNDTSIGKTDRTYDSSANKIRNKIDNEDILNESRETDELTNNSGLNQSGDGCELIGINDSDIKISPSSNSNLKEAEMPYNVQLFNDTISPSKIINVEEKQSEQNVHFSCNKKILDLEQQTKLLTENVDKLQLQVNDLIKKLSNLENQNYEQKSFYDNKNVNQSNLTRPNNLDTSTYIGKSVKNNVSTPLAGNLSQSSTNVNGISINAQQTTNPMMTYSRNNIATLSSRNLNNNDLLSTSVTTNSNYNTRLIPSSQSCNNSVAKSLKRNNVHASTNSLYPESLNSSISPTSNFNQQQQQQHYKRSNSPNSMVGSLSARRDPLSHTSMLSLSSLGCQSNCTTLRKGTPISGSISNLSQIGSQLLHWPSISDFVTTKHRGKEILYQPEKRSIEMILYNNLINMRVPNIMSSDYNLDKIVEQPNVRLKLDWVYGYRGRDCRTNLFYLATGECVYFVASIVVLYNSEEKTQRHYLGHTDSVKCLAVHPNKLTIASGQSSVLNRRDKRPIVRVWSIVNLTTLRVIGFNEDFDRSICCLAFSKHDNGATLAVVDESAEHTITLLDWQREKNWRLAETNSGHDPVLAIDFHPIDKYSLVTVGRSTINFWDTRGMTMTKKAGLFDKYDKPKYVLCLTFNDLGDTITGDSNGNVIIWPRGSNRPKKIIHDCHNGGVFSILTMKDGTYLTGGRDRRIIEWDESFVRTGREAELPEHCGGVRYITYGKGARVLVGTLRNSILLGSLENNFTLIMQGHAEATTALAVHPLHNQYLTGGFDDQIHLFDSKTHDVIWNKCIMMPATSASFSPNGSILVVGSTLGKWLVIDAISQEILFTKCDGSGTINCIKFSPDGEYFCMGSGDMQIYIYQTTESGNKFCRVGTCVGHSAPIKEIDWSDDGRYIQTQSMNFELLYWKAQNCRPIEDLNIISDLNWFTNNCTIGFNTIGLWSDSIDSALINNCDRSKDENLIVSATDTGNLNIFKWPACYNQCLSQKYYGNVEKFDFVRFSHDDSKLIAIGAKTCVTTEWIVDKENA